MASTEQFKMVMTYGGDAVNKTKELEKNMKATDKATGKLRKSVKGFSLASVVSIAAVTMAIRQAYRAMSNWVKMSNDQEMAEVKLTTVMRQRMNATDAQIESILKLTAAQQKIGVIGDEVQIAGAQQIATFLKQTESVKALIPAMNNLAAQQKGINATQQDMVNIANMMGKVLEGQVGALKRVGISFTEAQAKILKTGNEMERASTLAQVITDNVGKMNEALAKTPAGQMKQAEMAMGDFQEKLGMVIKLGIAPYMKDIADSLEGINSATGKSKVAEWATKLGDAIWGAQIIVRSFGWFFDNIFTGMLLSVKNNQLAFIGVKITLLELVDVLKNKMATAVRDGLTKILEMLEKNPLTKFFGIGQTAINNAKMELIQFADVVENTAVPGLDESQRKFAEVQGEVDKLNNYIKDGASKITEFGNENKQTADIIQKVGDTIKDPVIENLQKMQEEIDNTKDKMTEWEEFMVGAHEREKTRYEERRDQRQSEMEDKIAMDQEMTDSLKTSLEDQLATANTFQEGVKGLVMGAFNSFRQILARKLVEALIEGRLTTILKAKEGGVKTAAWWSGVFPPAALAEGARMEAGIMGMGVHHEGYFPGSFNAPGEHMARIRNDETVLTPQQVKRVATGGGGGSLTLKATDKTSRAFMELLRDMLIDGSLEGDLPIKLEY